jgi:hypothetical protein
LQTKNGKKGSNATELGQTSALNLIHLSEKPSLSGMQVPYGLSERNQSQPITDQIFKSINKQ